jgi:hypothetical protein
MKKALLTLAAVAMASSAFAQGTILFFNGDISDGTGGVYQAEVKRQNGTGAGTGITAGLFFASDPDTATPIATTTFFGSTGFFATANEVPVTGKAPGTTADLQVRAWETSAGSFAAAKGGAGLYGSSGAFTSLPLGGPNPPNPAIPSPDMRGLQSFTLVPEPTTYALGLLGLGALAMMRRRK